MACTCTTLTQYALDCNPTIGGIASVTIDTVEIQTLPDTSTFSSVCTYDKSRNLRYWTTTVELNLGQLTAAARTLAEALPCPAARTIVLTLNDGHTVTVSDAFVKEINFSVAGAKTDGSDSKFSFEAITQNCPQVVDPTP